ncbi:MAG: MutS family DNA mismatch repair protein [Bacillota bacterium]|nr:MutS family DNA mismatch repair protein [Bacillota bacterium]
MQLIGANKIFKKFQERKAAYEIKLKKARKLSGLISTFRLLAFLFAAAIFGFGLHGEQFYLFYFAVPLIVLFIFLIIKHNSIKNRIDFLEKVISINEDALRRLSGQWTSFSDSGERFINNEHPYTTDLNIFGHGSLFQYINTTSSFTGEQTLVKQLRVSADLEEIRPRQQAISDLAGRLDFRQHFQAEGTDTFFKTHDPADLLSWSEEKPSISRKNLMDYLWVLPAVTLLFLLLAVLQVVPPGFFVFALLMQVIAAGLGEKVVREAFSNTEKAVDQLKRYVRLLQYIEAENFKAPFLLNLKQRLFTDSRSALDQIKALSKIGDRINLRYGNSLIYFPVNIAVLWDLHTLKKLDGWKRQSGLSLRVWFNIVGEFEALSSLAVIAQDHPDWVYPQVSGGAPVYEAKSLGHPLIGEEFRVNNDLRLSGPGAASIITGSNMSGKSTYLRTAGINLVLAYSGAPVCAESMSCSLMRIYSKMQIHDNLTEKVSTFYAELKRIKMIIDAAQTGAPLIFLLDEIFRGTNSRDRIFSTRNVVKQLHKLSTIGLITTHDLELSVLEKEYPGSIINYHFTDEIDDDGIHFDYKLKPGVSQTANAVALMKMIGIEVEADPT